MWAKTLVGASRCSNWLRIGTPPQSSDASTLDWPQDHGPAVWRGKSSLKSEDTNQIPIHEHIQVPIFYQTWPPKVQLTKHSPKKTSPQEQKNYMSSFTPYKCSPFLPSTCPSITAVFHLCQQQVGRHQFRSFGTEDVDGKLQALEEEGKVGLVSASTWGKWANNHGLVPKLTSK